MNGAVALGLTNMIVDIIRERAGVTTICDLGCGNGFLASKLGALGYDVTGLDASDKLLAVARTHYGSDHVRFEKAVFGEHEILDGLGTFDLVVSSDVIEHLYHPTSLIDTALRLLKPGGVFVCATPYNGYLKNLAISVIDRWDLYHSVHWDGGHIKFFSVKTLGAMIERGGFAVDGFRYYGRVPGFWKNMICLATKRA
jgi:2-polyprenyl-3-methyl-5-hydroxy-6-metoxy-1,4-benzoquinol methylase